MDSLLELFPYLALCIMRPMGMMLLLPLFKGDAMTSPLVRNAMILMIAVPILPTMHHMGADLVHLPMQDLVLVYFKELLIGFVLGFCAAIPFWAIDMSGFVIDTMRGASMSTVLNPQMGVESSIFGIFFTQLLSVLFLITGGFNVLILSLYQSYTLLPPDSPLVFDTALLNFFTSEWRTMLDLCMGFALPSMVVMILIDTALGLMNRSVEQLNVFFLSMPIKSLLVVLLLLITIHYSVSYYLNEINLFEKKVMDLFQIWKG